MSKERHGVQFNYSKINEHIYLGSNMCCQTHFDKKLLQKGVTLDVSMGGERMDRPGGIRYYLWLPTVDYGAPTMRRLAMGVTVIREAVTANEKLYVHCKNGHGRAPTMVAAYFVKERGMSVREAVDYIKYRRPEIHIEPTQMKRLKECEKICRKA